MKLRSALTAVPSVVVLLAASLMACGGSSSEDDTTAGALGDKGEPQSCAVEAVPSSLEGFKKLESCQLQTILDSERAKANTSVLKGMPDGPYDGIPLCKKDVLEQTHGRDLPAGVRRIGGSKFVFDLLKATETGDNFFASKLWHGKEFTRAPGAERGDVLNFIDVTESDINGDTKKSAEATYYVDPAQNWVVLNYKDAHSGLPIAKDFSVELIKQVYDTMRLVDVERGIYLGMAYLVDVPGELTLDRPGSFAKSCYFALQKKATPVAPGDDKK